MPIKGLDTKRVADIRQAIANKLSANVSSTRSTFEDNKAMFVLGTFVFGCGTIGIAIAGVAALPAIAAVTTLVSFSSMLAYRWGHSRAETDAAAKTQKDFAKNPGPLVAAELAGPKVQALINLHECRNSFERAANHHEEVVAKVTAELEQARATLVTATEQTVETLRQKDGLQAPRKSAPKPAA